MGNHLIPTDIERICMQYIGVKDIISKTQNRKSQLRLQNLSVSNGKIDEKIVIAVVGGPDIGKSTAIARFISGNYADSYGWIKRINLFRKVINIENRRVVLEIMEGGVICDLQLFERANAFLVMYSIDSWKSFVKAKEWLQRIKRNRMDDWKQMTVPIHLIICGNEPEWEETDLSKHVSDWNAAELAETWNCPFLKISKTMRNVPVAFHMLAQKFIETANISDPAPDTDRKDELDDSCSCKI